MMPQRKLYMVGIYSMSKRTLDTTVETTMDTMSQVSIMVIKLVSYMNYSKNK